MNILSPLSVAVLATPAAPAPSVMLLVCSVSTGQVCTKDGCEPERDGSWQFLFVLDPAGDGELRRTLVVDVDRGEVTPDHTIFRLTTEDIEDKDGRMVVWSGSSGIDATDMVVMGEGGGFTSVKSSRGYFTSRFGKCAGEELPKSRLEKRLLEHVERWRPQAR